MKYKFKAYLLNKQTVSLSMSNGETKLEIEPAALKWTCDFKTQDEVFKAILDYSRAGMVCSVESF